MATSPVLSRDPKVGKNQTWLYDPCWSPKRGGIKNGCITPTVLGSSKWGGIRTGCITSAVSGSPPQSTETSKWLHNLYRLKVALSGIKIFVTTYTMSRKMRNCGVKGP